jgi:hypothetical protein
VGRERIKFGPLKPNADGKLASTSTGRVGPTLHGPEETECAFNIVSAPKTGISAVETLIAEAKDKIMLGKY